MWDEGNGRGTPLAPHGKRIPSSVGVAPTVSCSCLPGGEFEKGAAHSTVLTRAPHKAVAVIDNSCVQKCDRKKKVSMKWHHESSSEAAESRGESHDDDCRSH